MIADLCVLLQIPRYIITLHELLAHTPHDHVERESLEYAKSKLEELSKVRVVRFFIFLLFLSFCLWGRVKYRCTERKRDVKRIVPHVC